MIEIAHITLDTRSSTLSVRIRHTATSLPRQEQNRNLASICHAITDLRSRNFGYGLLLGCRLPQDLDGGHEKNNFFYAFPPQKTVKSSSDGRDRHRN